MAERVVYGINSHRAKLSGLTLSAVRERYGQVYSIPPTAIILVNGKLVEDESYIVQEGDEVNFVREVGKKGSPPPFI